MAIYTVSHPPPSARQPLLPKHLSMLGKMEKKEEKKARVQRGYLQRGGTIRSQVAVDVNEAWHRSRGQFDVV